MCGTEPEKSEVAHTDAEAAFIAEHGRLLRPETHAAFDAYRRAEREKPTHVKLLHNALALILVPFRVLVALSVTLVSYVLVCVFGPRVTPARVFAFEPTLLPPWRRRIVRAANSMLGRGLLLAFGFWRVDGADHPDFDDAEAATATVVSNHSSLADPCLLAYLSAPAFIAKSDVYRIPGVGRVGAAQHAFYIDRMHNSRVSLSAKIAERQRLVAETHGALPHVAIFPEGTTTNGRHLLRFRTGAFVAGAPVAPVLIRYAYEWFSPSYESINTGTYVAGLLSQPANRVHYYRLPVYRPSAAERESPTLYADNVFDYIQRESQRVFGEALVPSKSNLVDKMEYHYIIRGDKLKPGLKLNAD